MQKFDVHWVFQMFARDAFSIYFLNTRKEVFKEVRCTVPLKKCE